MSNLWRLQRKTYKGLLMRCAPGTHEAAVALLLRHCSLRSSVLDLGAGSGALLARLRDNGFNNLGAIETNAKEFELEGVAPHPIDLNSGFARAVERPFQVVTAIEVIEHLDSPWHFLQQAYEILESGGYLLLSTPNVSNWLGRIEFLLTGKLRYFDRAQYRQMRHISPLSDELARLILEEIGFHLVDSTTAGGFSGPLRQIATAPISVPFRLLFGPRAWGDVSVYLLQKPPSDRRSSGEEKRFPSSSRG